MELPCELIDEILTRIPVKYVLRCRSVSKEWCSVIDSKVFVKKYLEVSIERNRGGIIIQGSALVNLGAKYLLADFDSSDNGNVLVDLSEDVLKWVGIVDGARVIGSANGLVCLSMFGGNRDSVLLFNPCTRKCKKLPVAGTEFLDNNNLSRYLQRGFGYDHVGDDYKVVLLARHKIPTEGAMAIVYSLKKDSWTPIPNVCSTENIRFTDTLGTFANGALLWRALDRIFKTSVVVGFDLNREQFIEVQCCVRNVHLMDISIEQSRAEEILLNPVLRCSNSVRPLRYSKNFEKILLEVDCKKFMWYDIRSKIVKNITVPGIPNRFFSHRYIESLFPLIGDSQTSYEAKQKTQLKKRFLTMVLVMCSVVGSLMIFSRSRR